MSGGELFVFSLENDGSEAFQDYKNWFILAEHPFDAVEIFLWSKHKPKDLVFDSLVPIRENSWRVLFHWEGEDTEVMYLLDQYDVAHRGIW